MRENTEGEYSQAGGFLYRHTPDEVALQTAVFTRRGVERIVRYAFDLARRRDRKKVTSITKSNAQGYSMVLWTTRLRKWRVSTRMWRGVAAGRCRGRPLCSPSHTFDVVVGSNLFGDILSDLAAAITAASAWPQAPT